MNSLLSKQRDIDTLRRFIDQYWTARSSIDTIINSTFMILPNGTITHRTVTNRTGDGGSSSSSNSGPHSNGGGGGGSSNNSQPGGTGSNNSPSATDKYNVKSMTDDNLHRLPGLTNRLLYIETKHWLDLMTLTVDGMVFFVNFILSCYMIYRICHIVNHHSNDVINSLLLHKALIGLIIGLGFTCFDIFLIFSTKNHPLYRTLMKKIPISISWSSLCFLKLNFKEIMTTCYMYYIVIVIIVLVKLNIIPSNINRQWKIFLAFLHGIPWIIVFLVQLLLYIVGTFQQTTTQQRYRRTNCNFLLRESYFSLLFESLLISFPSLFALVIIVLSIAKYCPNFPVILFSSASVMLSTVDEPLVIPTELTPNHQINPQNKQQQLQIQQQIHSQQQYEQQIIIDSPITKDVNKLPNDLIPTSASVNPSSNINNNNNNNNNNTSSTSAATNVMYTTSSVNDVISALSNYVISADEAVLEHQHQHQHQPLHHHSIVSNEHNSTSITTITNNNNYNNYNYYYYNNSSSSTICNTDTPLILAISFLLLICQVPSLILRLMMNFYWIYKYPIGNLNFVYCICAFICLCFFALHPLLILIYMAWKDSLSATQQQQQQQQHQHQQQQQGSATRHCSNVMLNSIGGQNSIDYGVNQELSSSAVNCSNNNNSYTFLNNEDPDDMNITSSMVVGDHNNMKYLMSSV